MEPVRPHRYSVRTKLVHSATRVGRAMEVVAASVLPILPNRSPRGEVHVGRYVVRYYRHWPSDPRLIGEWDALSQSVPGGMAFQSPHWQQAAARIPDAFSRLRLITLHDGDRLVGVLPLERRWGGRLRSIGLLTTAYHDPLFAAESPAELWSAALEGIRRLPGDEFCSISFERLHPDSALLPVADDAGFVAELSPTHYATTVIPLAATWDEYLAKLPPHHRKELRRKIRKAEQQGGAKLVISQTEADVKAAIPPLLRLMEAAGGAKGRKSRWLFRHHLKECTGPLASTGRMAVYQLLIGGCMAAGIIALPQAGGDVLWNTAMDPAFREWSPGIALFGMVVRRAIERGQKSLDLLLGLMPYKDGLGAIERPLRRLTLTRRP